MELLSLCEQTVKFGEKLGAKEVEVYASNHYIRSVDFTTKIKSTNTSSFMGLGIRVTCNKKLGFYSTSRITKQEILKAVKSALSIAKVSQPNTDWLSFPLKHGRASVEEIFDKTIVGLNSDTLCAEAAKTIETVHNHHTKVRVTRGDIIVGKRKVAISNSYNCNLERKSTFVSATLTIQAEGRGMKGQSSESIESRRWRDVDMNALSQHGAERAIKMIDAKPIKSDKITIIWRNKRFANILRIMFGRTLSADSIQKNRSPWIGKIGQKIASENVNIFDDGIREGGWGTRPFDDEGIPQQKTSLIKQGTLLNYLYDNYTANKEGKESTGNAYRNYRSSPSPIANNLSLGEGEATIAELIEDTKYGLYIYEVIGDWLSNPISGNLSATITNGCLIEKGEITQPIKGVIISTNFFKILNDPTLLIAKNTQNSGSVYSPSVKMNNITLAGV